MEYRNIHQRLTKMVDTYAARFRKAISKAEMGNLLSAQMQVMDFVARLRSELAIITNSSNRADLDKVKKIAKMLRVPALSIKMW